MQNQAFNLKKKRKRIPSKQSNAFCSFAKLLKIIYLQELKDKIVTRQQRKSQCFKTKTSYIRSNGSALRDCQERMKGLTEAFLGFN